MKSPWETLKATPLFLLLLSHSLASAPYEDQPGTSYSNGHNCVGCVVVVSVIEQLAEVHNSSVQVAMERLCSYLPEKLFLKTTCYYLVQMFGSDIIKLLGEAMNADVVCHALEFCKQDAVQSQCHLYPLPQDNQLILECPKHSRDQH
ncbi:acyloxyacyl hydrolase isoform X2 [Cricetulus griseus]|uniref:Acyloxyacyl hydrolase n=1 Tax=Cricetulus griseus TaxID=10029 RepID=A0A9J7GUM0_CRIGR|nr:acyloxyacyl hydrolase isoform X2 [Cricetulus griseus]XP_035313759.1 acyloxyacyl hydrolase isoform X2 [Cricetulus griseus]